MGGDVVPPTVLNIANGLMYRDFITIGVLFAAEQCQPMADNWVYVQEPAVRMGRIQFFNNWSPFMVRNPGDVWIGTEYFCSEGDSFWNLADNALQQTATTELVTMGIVGLKEQPADSTVIRVEKAYPAYFGTYNRFQVIKDFVKAIPNLFLIGRNGMHRYNNMDHSMLTAKTAVENIVNGRRDQENIWSINTEEDYHEEQ